MEALGDGLLFYIKWPDFAKGLFNTTKVQCMNQALVMRILTSDHTTSHLRSLQKKHASVFINNLQFDSVIALWQFKYFGSENFVLP